VCAAQALGSFNDDISAWNTARVTDLGSAFEASASFNRNIAKWNVASVTSMNSAFRSAKVFGQNLASWNVLRVTALQTPFFETALTDCIKKGMSTSWGATLQAEYPTWSALCNTPTATPTPARLVAAPGTMVLIF